QALMLVSVELLRDLLAILLSALRIAQIARVRVHEIVYLRFHLLVLGLDLRLLTSNELRGARRGEHHHRFLLRIDQRRFRPARPLQPTIRSVLLHLQTRLLRAVVWMAAATRERGADERSEE